MFKKHLYLNFDDDKETYISGEQISGTVILDLDEPTKVSEIYLKVKGEGLVSWQIEIKGRVRSGTGVNRQKTRTISAGDDFIDSAIAIWKPGVSIGEGETQDPNIIPAGEHKFNWSFQLSKSLPSSHKNVFGHIKYHVKVKVDRPWAIDWEEEKKFTVIEFCDLQNHPRTRDEVIRRDNIFAGYLFFFRKPIDVVIKLPSGGMISEQSFPIHIEITNKSPRNISYSALKLKQMCKMSIGKQKQEWQKIVFEHKQGTIAAGQTGNWDDVTMTLPSLASSGGSWNHLQIEYEFKFIVKTAWFGPRMKVKWPMVIGTHFHSGSAPTSNTQYVGPAPAPYTGPVPASSVGPVPTPYAGPAPAPYPGGYIAPYPGVAPAPYPGVSPSPHSNISPVPYGTASATPYPGASHVPYPGAIPTPYAAPSPAPYSVAPPASYPGAPAASYPGASPAACSAAPPAPYQGAQLAPYPGAYPNPHPGTFPQPYSGAQSAPYPVASSPYPPSSQNVQTGMASDVKPDMTSDSERIRSPYPGDSNIGGTDAPEASAPPPDGI